VHRDDPPGAWRRPIKGVIRHPLDPVHRDDPPGAWRSMRRALDGTSIHVVAGVDAPLDLAVGLELVLPWRIRLGTTFGVLPRSVARAINGQLVDHGAYARPLGDLVDASLERVLLWHGHVGVQPWTKHGLIARVGYGVAWTHGAVGAVQVADAIEVMVPDGTQNEDARVELASRLHLVEVELGWEWRWQRRWSLRVGVGVAITRSARTRAALQVSTSDPRLQELADQAAARIDDTYTTYVRTPIVSSFVGYEL
jgi:hypothetical protein